MHGRDGKPTWSGWRLWALGAAVSTACAALLLLRRRSASRVLLDPNEQWWRQRERIRGDRNGGEHNYHLFV